MSGTVKVKDAMQGRSAFAAYRALMYGTAPLGYVIRAELVQSCLAGLGGALGILLRGWFYKGLFGSVSGKVVIGRHVTLRHPHKIHLGRGVVLDENCMIDAKGQDNRGIAFGDGVFIGRGSIVYCKNGNITLGDRVNVSSSCTLFSSNELTIGAGTLIGAYTYVLSGGEYDPADPRPFAEQDGMKTAGPLSIGPNCWLGARVTVLDAAGTIGAGSIIGAGAVVNRPVPARSLAVGIPARPIRTLDAGPAMKTAS